MLHNSPLTNYRNTNISNVIPHPFWVPFENHKTILTDGYSTAVKETNSRYKERYFKAAKIAKGTYGGGYSTAVKETSSRYREKHFKAVKIATGILRGGYSTAVKTNHYVTTRSRDLPNTKRALHNR
jgi:hypothetical protein